MYVRYPFTSRAHRGQTRIYSFFVIATFISTEGWGEEATSVTESCCYRSGRLELHSSFSPVIIFVCLIKDGNGTFLICHCPLLCTPSPLILQNEKHPLKRASTGISHATEHFPWLE